MNLLTRSVVAVLFVAGLLASGCEQKASPSKCATCQNAESCDIAAAKAASKPAPAAKKEPAPKPAPAAKPKPAPKAKPTPKPAAETGFKPLFDGKSLAGWEGDPKLWSVKDGILIGRTASGIKHNHFLCSKEAYENFELRAKFRLVGGKGNSGFQFRSERLDDYVLKGYQADVGAIHWGSLYDEKRRGKLAAAVPETKKHYTPDGWNEFVIRADGPNIELKLNGFTTLKYTEKDAKIPRTGIIGPQLHVGPPMELQIKEICIKTLPSK